MLAQVLEGASKSGFWSDADDDALKAVALFLQGIDKTCSSECTLNQSQVGALPMSSCLQVAYDAIAVYPVSSIMASAQSFGLAADEAGMLMGAMVLQSHSNPMSFQPTAW